MTAFSPPSHAVIVTILLVPHPVKEGESFQVPHPDTQKNLQLTNNPHLNDGVVGRIACCCNAAPCCFPDGCCPGEFDRLSVYADEDCFYNIILTFDALYLHLH
eukprot:scaffold3927_cov179-Skeletonema_marinoi.AAC.4